MNLRFPNYLRRPLAGTLALLCATPALAFGLNNIYGGQTIGKPFYAEIPLQSAPNVTESCVSLRPGEGTVEFFIADLKASVAGPANARRLVISSLSPVRSPMISFVVDVQCTDAAMAREYTLLADNARIEPLMRRPESVPLSSALSPAQSAQAAASPAPMPAGASFGAGGETLLLAGATTLNALARVLYPEDRAARDAYRAAFALANPELFAGKDNIGSIALPAGTRLKAPAGVPLPAVATLSKSARTAQPDIGAAAPATSTALKSGTNGASNGASKAATRAEATTPARADTRKGDRLSLGTANSQMQMLADAIMRLEATMIERDKVNAELVGGVSSALNSIIELKDRVGGQDKQVQQLIALQIETERLRAQERDAQPGPWTLLGLMLVAMGAGAGLITLHHTLAARRREPVPRSFHDAVAADDGPVAVRDPWAQAADQGAPDADDDDDEPPPSPPRARAYESSPLAAATAATAAAAPSPAPASAPVLRNTASKVEAIDTREELELGDLLDLFSEQKAAVTSMIGRLKATRSRDPDEWLTLLREARTAGLLNTDELQTVLTQFKQLFNADVTPETCNAGIDTFPQVIKRLHACWGTGECLRLLNELLYDDRDGGRQGFPEGAFADLVLLRDVLAVRIAMYGEEAASVAPVETSPVLEPTRAEHRGAAANVIDFQLDLPPPKA